eukprot:5850134-Prymnesium_polylepis.2
MRAARDACQACASQSWQCLPRMGIATCGLQRVSAKHGNARSIMASVCLIMASAYLIWAARRTGVAGLAGGARPP